MGRSWNVVTAHAALNTCSFPWVAGRTRSVKYVASMNIPMHGTNLFKNLSKASPSPAVLCTAGESIFSNRNSSTSSSSSPPSSSSTTSCSSTTSTASSGTGGVAFVCFKHFRHSWSLNTLFDLGEFLMSLSMGKWGIGNLTDKSCKSAFLPRVFVLADLDYRL